MKNTQKGFIGIVIGIIAGLIIGVGGAYIVLHKKTSNEPSLINSYSQPVKQVDDNEGSDQVQVDSPATSIQPKPSSDIKPPADVKVDSKLTVEELNNLSYQTFPYRTGESMTLVEGKYKSAKIVCSVSTCMNGNYYFAKISKVGFNKDLDTAVVVIVAGYSPDEKVFNRVYPSGTEFIEVFMVTKKNGKISISKSYDHLSECSRFDEKISHFVPVKAEISDVSNNEVILSGTVHKSDGSGNFTITKTIFTLRYENDSWNLVSLTYGDK